MGAGGRRTGCTSSCRSDGAPLMAARRCLHALLLGAHREEVMTLQNLRHPNVLQFLGACNKPPNLCMVTEHMPFSLHNVLYTSKAQVWRARLHVLMRTECLQHLQARRPHWGRAKQHLTQSIHARLRAQLDRAKVVAMAQDIVRAIAYLHSRKPPVVCVRWPCGGSTPTACAAVSACNAMCVRVHCRVCSHPLL